MDFNVSIRTYSGIEDFSLTEDKIGQLEQDVIKNYDPRIADIVCLFLEEEFSSEGMATPQAVLDDELVCNTADGKVLFGYTATIEYGATLTVEQIKDIFHYIWKDYLFWEVTGLGLHYDMIQFFKKLERTTDPEELLFWSFRFCAWGGFDNHLPYTLYRAILDGRFKDYYDRYPEWNDTFLVLETKNN